MQTSRWRKDNKWLIYVFKMLKYFFLNTEWKITYTNGIIFFF